MYKYTICYKYYFIYTIYYIYIIYTKEEQEQCQRLVMHLGT